MSSTASKSGQVSSFSIPVFGSCLVNLQYNYEVGSFPIIANELVRTAGQFAAIIGFAYAFLPLVYSSPIGVFRTDTGCFLAIPKYGFGRYYRKFAPSRRFVGCFVSPYTAT